MSCVQLSERGVSRWFTPSACGPGHPQLSKSYMDMASKLFTFTFTFTFTLHACTSLVRLFEIVCTQTYGRRWDASRAGRPTTKTPPEAAGTRGTQPPSQGARHHEELMGSHGRTAVYGA